MKISFTDDFGHKVSAQADYIEDVEALLVLAAKFGAPIGGETEEGLIICGDYTPQEPAAPVEPASAPMFDLGALYVTTAASVCNDVLSGSIVSVEDQNPDTDGEVWVDAGFGNSDFIDATKLELLIDLSLSAEEVAVVHTIFGNRSGSDDRDLGIDAGAAYALWRKLDRDGVLFFTETEALIIVTTLGNVPVDGKTFPAYYRLYKALQQRGIEAAMRRQRALSGDRPLIGASE